MHGQIVFGKTKDDHLQSRVSSPPPSPEVKQNPSSDQKLQPEKKGEEEKPSLDKGISPAVIAQTDSAYIPKDGKEAQEIGEKQALRDTQKAEEKSKQKLDNLLQNAHKVVLSIKNTFPFVLFPDELIIDANKVDIIYNEFFSSSQAVTILVNDIADVVVETSLFFAALKITTKSKDFYTVRYLKKADAIRARRILEGIILTLEAGIDLTSIDKGEIQSKVEAIGRAKERV